MQLTCIVLLLSVGKQSEVEEESSDEEDNRHLIGVIVAYRQKMKGMSLNHRSL